METIQHDHNENNLCFYSEKKDSNKKHVFNSSFTYVGKYINVAEIYASYDLTIIGDVTAEKIKVKGSLTVIGNLKSDELMAKSLLCNGDVTVTNAIQCSGNIVSNSIESGKLSTNGNVSVVESLIINQSITVSGNIISGQIVDVAGDIKAETVMSGSEPTVCGDCSSKILCVADHSNDGGALDFKNDIVVLLQKAFNMFDKNEIVTIVNDLFENKDFIKLGLLVIGYIIEKVSLIIRAQRITSLNDHFYVSFIKKYFPTRFLNIMMIKKVVDLDSSMWKVNKNGLRCKISDNLELSILLQLNLLLFDGDEENYYAIYDKLGLKYSFVKQNLGTSTTMDTKQNSSLSQQKKFVGNIFNVGDRVRNKRTNVYGVILSIESNGTEQTAMVKFDDGKTAEYDCKFLDKTR